jgi:two-component system OmpR family response regulator
VDGLEIKDSFFNVDDLMSKVLVVEDDRRQRWLYYEELKNEGHQVLAVRQGEHALEVLDHVPIEVVVMDLLLPDGKGLEYLQKMLARNPTLKVIINSAHPIYKQDFRSWGADRFVTKSSDLCELKNAVSEIAAG